MDVCVFNDTKWLCMLDMIVWHRLRLSYDIYVMHLTNPLCNFGWWYGHKWGKPFTNLAKPLTFVYFFFKFLFWLRYCIVQDNSKYKAYGFEQTFEALLILFCTFFLTWTYELWIFSTSTIPKRKEGKTQIGWWLRLQLLLSWYKLIWESTKLGKTTWLRFSLEDGPTHPPGFQRIQIYVGKWDGLRRRGCAKQ